MGPKTKPSALPAPKQGKSPATTQDRAPHKKVEGPAVTSSEPQANTPSGAQQPSVVSGTGIQGLPGQGFPFLRLAEVAFDDRGGLWKPSGKWPFIQDVTGKTATFLKYRNTIYVDTFSPAQMDPNALRRCFLGCLRYGKMIVFDLNDAPMILDQVRIHVDLVLPNLFDAVVSKDFRKKEVYSKMLMQPQDGPEYEEFQFSATMIDQASVVFVSAAETVDPEVTSKFVLLRVES